MSGFDLQDFLDQQLEHNILNQPVRSDNFQDVDVAGFGFPSAIHPIDVPASAKRTRRNTSDFSSAANE